MLILSLARIHHADRGRGTVVLHTTDHVAGACWECLGALCAGRRAHCRAAPHQIIRWLRCQSPAWPATFVAVCDSVFGTPCPRGRRAARLYRLAYRCLSSAVPFQACSILTSRPILLVLFLYAPALVGSLALVNLLPSVSLHPRASCSPPAGQ